MSATVIVQCSADPEPALDIRGRSFKMPRNASVLYPRTGKWKDADPPGWTGLMVLESGQRFWVNLWARKVGNKEVFELRLTEQRKEAK